MASYRIITSHAQGPVDVAGLGERQIWTLQPRNGGSFAIVCKNTDLLLGLHNGHLEDSASVVVGNAA